MASNSSAANAANTSASTFNTKLAGVAAAGALAGIAAASYYSVGGVSLDTPQLAAAAAAGVVYAYVMPMNMSKAAFSTTDVAALSSAINSAAWMSVAEAGAASGLVLMGMAGLSVMDAGIFAAAAAGGVYLGQKFA